MSAAESGRLRLHLDPAGFLEAVSATAAETGFAPRLVEKDYFCTLLLQHLAPRDGPLVFKGGTCLAKIHAGFYRLSEDLDFTIPTPIGSPRSERSRRAGELKDLFAGIGDGLPGVHLREPLSGANNSSQYTAVLAYRSVLGDKEETIKFEAGLREPLLLPAVQGDARTLLRDPVSGEELVPALPVPSLSREEAMAEKLRAALSRRDVAIRDFYDVDHAVQQRGLRLDDPPLLGLVKRKLAMPGNGPPNVTPERMSALRPQLESDLMPVLRPSDFQAFDLDRAVALVAGVAATL